MKNDQFQDGWLKALKEVKDSVLNSKLLINDQESRKEVEKILNKICELEKLEAIQGEENNEPL